MRSDRRGKPLVVEAPAKLNLFLEVLGRRADGYHDLETVMAAINLRDTLTFRPAPAGVLRFTQRLALSTAQLGPAPPVGDGNLVLRAARLLAAATSTAAGAEIELIKRIPWQAGLGGGSSDAATTLLALNQLWGLRLPLSDLHTIAAQLGSDLNFFIARTTAAVCRDRGESVQPRALRRRLDFVLAQPVGGLATADVFRRWSRSDAPQTADAWLNWLADGTNRRAAPPPYNALLAPARELHPGVAETCRRLVAAGAVRVGMTGSGSVCFGMCRSRRHALAVAGRIRRGACTTWVTQTGT